MVDQQQVNLHGLAWLFTGRSIKRTPQASLRLVTIRATHFWFHCIDGRRLCSDDSGSPRVCRGRQGLGSDAGFRRSPKSVNSFSIFCNSSLTSLSSSCFPFSILAVTLVHVLDLAGLTEGRNA